MNTCQEVYKSLTLDKAEKVEEKLAAFGISVRKEDGTFKSLYQVIEELAEKCYTDACAKRLANMANIKDIKVGDYVQFQ